MNDFPRELFHGSGVMLVLDATRLLVEFRQPTEPAEVESILEPFELMLEPDEGSDRSPERVRAEKITHTDHRFWVRTRTGRPIDDDTYSALRNALQDRIEWLGPVYDMPNTPGRGGRVCPLPNVLVLRAAHIAGEDQDPLAEVARQLELEEDTERSRYLTAFRVYTISNADERNAYQLREVILQEFRRAVQDVKFETMPMVRDLTLNPNDTLYPQQWGMTQIAAGGAGTTGWDLSTGSNTIIVAVLDYGFDLTHPDLTYVAGVNLSTMTALTSADSGTDPHGTSCAGIISAGFNNATGVAGLAGVCPIMPVRRISGSDVETATGINWAATNGAHVLSMSFGRYAPGEGAGPTGWDFTLIDPEIANGVNVSGCVLCAATGNENLGTVNRYPARHALVIACGASDQADNRKSPTSPDGETWWGSNFGTNIHLGVTTGVSVVAPGVLIPTTDMQGTLGYNTMAGSAGDYVMNFNGTSSATPHVAGLAALLRSLYPASDNVQVRTIIERTAEKVGIVAYADVAGFNSGTRNQEMGYGRINVLRALDYADALIKDWPGDIGVEPSTPPGGNFWSFSDIVVRITDDGVFDPGDPSRSSNVERGQTNYLYIQVTNNGSRDARNVVVSARITPYVGLEFVYPTDWTATDATHVSPTPVTATFASIPAGGSAMAKFTISSAQVDSLWGWISGMNWHPCLLAAVNADNDYAFATASLTGGGLVVRRNNLAQRNLSVIDVLDSAAVTFPLLAGHMLNADPTMEIVVDRSRLPRTMPLLLDLEDDGRAFPLVELRPTVTPDEREEGAIVFLERTKIEAMLGCCRGVLTLEKGSRFDCPPAVSIGNVSVQGGEVILRDNRRFVEVRDEIAVIRMEKQPSQLYPLALHTTIPAEARNGDTYSITVAQRNAREETVGGATVIYSVE